MKTEFCLSADHSRFVLLHFVLYFAGLVSFTASAQPMFPGGSLSPDVIPKYVIPLVIPPVMPNNGKKNQYEIAVRQFQQQILPGGIWSNSCLQALSALGLSVNEQNSLCNYPATAVWSYGPASTPVPNPGSDQHTAPDLSGVSGFNYPAFTFETRSARPVDVRWINELVTIDDTTGKPYPVNSEQRHALPHLLPVDQTLHWANPVRDCAFSALPGGSLRRTDCAGRSPELYIGPVPIVTHVHGSHVDPDSDGYPEAWWLPEPDNSFPQGIASSGSLFDDVTGVNPGNLGYADYRYRNDQPATTLWYHDHSLGITRLNVYAGPAGFWLIRGGFHDLVIDGFKKFGLAHLPGPAPKRKNTMAELNETGNPVRTAIREIPLLLQDRSFNLDGSLFYPDNRAYFETLNTADGPNSNQFADFPFVGHLLMELGPPSQTDDDSLKSQIPPIWNTETFFNTIVVNGTVWPSLDVAPARYRFRFLNGANSRTFNLALFTTPRPGVPGAAKNCNPPPDNLELPIIQIGSDGGFLPHAVEILTGYSTPLKGNGKIPKRKKATPYGAQALLIAPAERADVVVDFSDLPNGSIIRLTNTAPDSPFGGFGRGDPPADCSTTGQIMQFVVNNQLLTKRDDHTTDPYNLRPISKRKYAKSNKTRQVSLNEQDSDFGISYNQKDVFYPASPDSEIGTEPDSGEYTVCAEISCTDEVQSEPFCAEPPCKFLSVSGFDPGGLMCPDDNDGYNAYRFTQIPFDPAFPDCSGIAETIDVYGPLVDLLGTVGVFPGSDGENPTGIPLRWTDNSGDSRKFAIKVPNGEVLVNVTEDPLLNTIEDWEIYNTTPDAHPIHIHLVQFNVIDRDRIPGNPTKDGYIPPCGPDGNPLPPPPDNPAEWNTDICWDRNLNHVVFPQEMGWKDTVIAHPGQVTTVRAKFDIPGLYVWHCHILEHEDNEMMRPYFVAKRDRPNKKPGKSRPYNSYGHFIRSISDYFFRGTRY